MEAILPPLSPLIVAKAPLLHERPREQRSGGNQEMLLALLNKRRKKYLARIDRDDQFVSVESGHLQEKVVLDKTPSNGLIPPSLYADQSSIETFAEHVIKCAKRRRKKAKKLQRKVSRNGRIIPNVQDPTASPTHPLSGVVDDKLSSPMKQEIRNMYRLKLAKHTTNCKSSQDESSTGHQIPGMNSKVNLASPPAVSTTPVDRSPQKHIIAQHKLIYLSERQSELLSTIGAPNPPPCTPETAEWSKLYVPSLHDIKSQRLLKSRLLAIETNDKVKQAKEKDKEIENRKKKELEELTKLRDKQIEIQRNEIYALNKVMAALQETKFSKFIDEKV